MQNNYNQSLQNKYPKLEISALALSEVKKDNETFRIDSEYFRKEYVENEKKIKKNDYTHFIKLIQSIYNGDDYRKYVENGIPYIRTGDIKEYGLNLENAEKVNRNFNFKRKLSLNDLLITRKGNYGKSAVVCDSQTLDSIISSEIFQIKLKDINPFYVDIFLKTKFGQLQFEKHIHGVSNFSVTQESLQTFLIPLLPKEFQLEIEKLVKNSHAALESSKALYKEAENLLYAELGIENNNMKNVYCHDLTKSSRAMTGDSVDCREFANANSRNDSNPSLTTTSSSQGAAEAIHSLESKFPHLNIRIKSLKDSLQTTGRLDAEYYQSKYEKIEALIKSYPGGYFKLKITDIKDSNFTPKENEKYHYIELADIGSNGNIIEPLVELGRNLPTRARRIVKEGNVIISSIEGSLSSCALITKEFDNCIVSTGFYVLKTKNVNSETLLVLFKSQFFQEYLKKFPNGTILTAISKEELQNILIPNIDSKIQEKIAVKIQKSFELRTKSKELLDLAKAKVENAIESNFKD